tara:strand:+ start:203 stop:1852 length:1650 start_codon:yes stop_codon:yes gene_type:complete
MQIPSSIVRNYEQIKANYIHLSSKNKIIVVTLLFALFYISLYFFIDFSTQSLVSHDEGLYSRRARLLEGSDNWFSPPFLSPHHKTIGSYWLISLSIKFFGKGELALRLPSILSSFLCLISTYLIALKITNKKSALISVFALSSTPLWIQYSRYASPDIPFVLCILLCILFYIKFLDSSEFIRQIIFIFLSGLFLSTSFFVRSYMALVPIIGLSPFIFYHLIKKENTLKFFFTSGIFIGFIPTSLNLYFSFLKFGQEGISALFDFAKKQAVGEFGLNNILLAPLKFIYLTYPVGILILILITFTKRKNKINYPLLIYCFPLLSLIILLLMSTSYPHYYIFILPFLSILFSSHLTSYSFRYSFSKISIRSFLLIINLFISIIIVFFIFNYSELLDRYAFQNIKIIYFAFTLLILSYFTSIIFLIDFKHHSINLTKFFFNIVIPQYISLSLLFNFGILGNPNFKTKAFLRDEIVSSIVKSNTIYLYSLDTKIQTLLSYYLPSSKVLYDLNEITKYKYIITSNINSLGNSDIKDSFVSVKKIYNHLLLKNISE